MNNNNEWNDDRLQQFRDFIDEEDESEFELVSSTKQRLEALWMEDDDIVVVTSRPTLQSHTTVSMQNFPRLPLDAIIACIFIGFLTYTIYLLAQRKTSLTPTKPSAQSDGTKTVTTTLSPRNEVDKTQEMKDPSKGDENQRIQQQQREDSQQTVLSNLQNEMPLLFGEHLTATSYQEETRIKHAAITGGNGGTPQTVSKFSTTTIMAIGSVTPTGISLLLDRETKIQVASQMAQDIKLVEDVLLQHGMDASLAPQLALSLQSSQQIIASQHELEARRLWVDTHQRHLDRQLSQRQHEEALQAAKYDPNWKEKLERKRDQCWDAVSRLLVEVAVSYQLAKLARPLLRWYQLETATASGKELLRLVLSSLCDCETTSKVVSGDTKIESFLYPSDIITAYFWHLPELDALMAYCACCGYCLASFVALLGIAILFHQVLRVFSAPSILHHSINAVAAIVLYSRSNLHFSTDANFLALCLVMLFLFGMVQWKYFISRKAIAQSIRQSNNFQTALDGTLDRMETLRFQLCLFRYLTVAIYCSSSLLQYS